MNILSIDSSNKQVSIALKLKDKIFNLKSNQEIRASQVVLPMIDEILKINNVDIITNLQTQNKQLENEIINITEKLNKLEELIQNLVN